MGKIIHIRWPPTLRHQPSDHVVFHISELKASRHTPPGKRTQATEDKQLIMEMLTNMGDIVADISINAANESMQDTNVVRTIAVSQQAEKNPAMKEKLQRALADHLSKTSNLATVLAGIQTKLVNGTGNGFSISPLDAADTVGHIAIAIKGMFGDHPPKKINDAFKEFKKMAELYIDTTERMAATA